MAENPGFEKLRLITGRSTQYPIPVFKLRIAGRACRAIHMPRFRWLKVDHAGLLRVCQAHYPFQETRRYLGRTQTVC